jgi:hypothetical protein
MKKRSECKKNTTVSEENGPEKSFFSPQANSQEISSAPFSSIYQGTLMVG